MSTCFLLIDIHQITLSGSRGEVENVSTNQIHLKISSNNQRHILLYFALRNNRGYLQLFDYMLKRRSIQIYVHLHND